MGSTGEGVKEDIALYACLVVLLVSPMIKKPFEQHGKKKINIFSAWCIFCERDIELELTYIHETESIYSLKGRGEWGVSVMNVLFTAP